MEIKDRVRELRERLGLSQAQLAARTGELDQSYITKIEAGRNKVSTVKLREALARGFWLKPDVFSDYIEGRKTLDEVARLTQEPRSTAPRTMKEGADSAVEMALAGAFSRSQKYGPLNLRALDFVREIFAPLTDEHLPAELGTTVWTEELTEAMWSILDRASIWPPYQAKGKDRYTFSRPPLDEWPELTPEMLLLFVVMDLRVSAMMYRAQLLAEGIQPLRVSAADLIGSKFHIEYDDESLKTFMAYEARTMRSTPDGVRKRLQEISEHLVGTSWPHWTPGIPTEIKPSDDDIPF